MDAAIGRLHLSITVAPSDVTHMPEPVQPDQEQLERAQRQDTARRAAEAERAAWTTVFHSRGRF